MKAYAIPQKSPSSGALWIGQTLAAIMLGLGLFMGLLALAPFGYALAYQDVVFPGVFVAGVDLSGKTPAEASALLAQSLQYSNTGQIYFQEGQTVYKATPR